MDPTFENKNKVEGVSGSKDQIEKDASNFQGNSSTASDNELSSKALAIRCAKLASQMKLKNKNLQSFKGGAAVGSRFEQVAD